MPSAPECPAENSEANSVAGIGKRFPKGRSGNPGGRPRIPDDVRELARAHTLEAVQTLVDVMRDMEAPPASRVRASECLLDRAWGKPETTATIRLPKDVRDLTTAEILARLSDTRPGEADEDEPDSIH